MAAVVAFIVFSFWLADWPKAAQARVALRLVVPQSLYTDSIDNKHVKAGLSTFALLPLKQVYLPSRYSWLSIKNYEC